MCDVVLVMSSGDVPFWKDFVAGWVGGKSDLGKLSMYYSTAQLNITVLMCHILKNLPTIFSPKCKA